MELVEAFTLVIYLYPGVVSNVYKNFILSLQPKLITELVGGLGAQNIMLSCLTRCRLEGALDVVENSEAVQSAALKVPIVVEGHADDLLVSFHLLHDLEVCAVKDLDVSLVEGDKDEAIVAECVKDLELTRHLLLYFKLVPTEEVKLHILILAQDCIDTDILDELRGGVQRKLVQWQPVVVKV